MTVWVCDRCGAQVYKDSYGAGKYRIAKRCADVDENGYLNEAYDRSLKFCPECSNQIEQLLDDELNGIPTQVMVELNKRA